MTSWCSLTFGGGIRYHWFCIHFNSLQYHQQSVKVLDRRWTFGKSDQTSISQNQGSIHCLHAPYQTLCPIWFHILTGQKFYHFTSRSFNTFDFLLIFLQAIQPNRSEITSATSSPAPEEKSAEDAGRAAYSTAMAVAWLKAFWGILPLKLWLMVHNYS